jgi:hypothetical protein
MAQLSWVTPSGTIGNLPIGLEMSIELLAVDTTNNGATLTYTLIGGELPPGMALNPVTGIISGTPKYSTPSNNYFTTLDYSFIVRFSTTNNLTPVDRSFSLIITNTVNADFTWITPGGNLGTVPNGEFYQLPLQVAETQPGVTTTFKFISGELPPGMQVVATGYLQGVPTLTTSVTTNTSQNFRFTIRATNSQGHVQDRAFNLSITNVYGPVIEPFSANVKNLGSYFDGSYYNQQLTVVEPNPNTIITWSNIGDLPPGVTLSSTGLLSGYILPAQVETQWGPAGYDAGNGDNTVSANSLVANVIYQIDSIGTTNFKLVGAKDNVVGTVFTASATGTGTGTGIASIYNVIILAAYIVAGQRYQIQTLGTTDFTLFGASSNSIGIVFTATHNGYDLLTPGTGSVSQYVNAGRLSSKQVYDFGPYDFTQVSQTTSYSFTIRAFDGANYDLQNYVINVVSRAGYTADNTQFTADNTFLGVDATNTYTPVILNTATTLPVGRGGSYYAYKFNGLDFQGDTITYSLSNTVGTFDAYVSGIDAGFDFGGTGVGGGREDGAGFSLTTAGRGGVPFDSFDSTGTSKTNLPGVLLDAQTGWVYGRLTPQGSSYASYRFGVIVSKTRDGITYSSVPTYVNLPVLGDVNNKINWVTPADLGTIDNGSVSEISLEAVSIEGKPLVYNLLDAAGVPIRLPQGLELITAKQNNKYLGLLSGRVTFEAFSVDDYATTFDGDSLTIDRMYKFTVEVSTDDAVIAGDGTLLTPPSATSTREFILTLNIIDIEPYNNLYLQAMPAHDQRQIFNSVINNTEIFVPELIYRPNDAWFGVSNDIEMLFLPGLNPDDMATYANAIIKNHYTKSYTFGNISTAVALDKNYNVKYEVIYVNVVDPEENSSIHGPALELDLTNTIQNPYIDEDGNSYKIVYPNSSENMVKRLTNGVGYYDQSSLPNWMTSNQPDPTNPSKFTTPLGFIKAVVLAYTIPGASKLIAYRLRNSGMNFNRINFSVDRYIVDDFYTTNFNTTTKQFELGRETTFDILPNQNIGTLVASVNYAVTIPFEQINGRPLAYINGAGGIDGVTNFRDGDTVVFAQQENFLNAGTYDGWVNYTNAWIGDNILTPSIEGYDSSSYDTYNVIPGYLEKAQGIAPINQRGGVWKINIINEFVVLTPVLEVEPGQRLRILFGSTYGGSIIYYNQTLNQGQTVPFYSIFKLQSTAITHRTTFNGDTTRFFNYRDQYYGPDDQGQYLKFLQYSVFT